MNVPPSEADRLPLWTYQALLWNWNDAQAGDNGDPPDPETTDALLAKINADPRLTGPTKAPGLVN